MKTAGVLLVAAGLLSAAAFPRSVPTSLACLAAVGGGLVLILRRRRAA